jgi:hypothetical protein
MTNIIGYYCPTPGLDCIPCKKQTEYIQTIHDPFPFPSLLANQTLMNNKTILSLLSVNATTFLSCSSCKSGNQLFYAKIEDPQCANTVEASIINL